MRKGLFWLNDKQWAQIEPHLPTNQTGPAREDDRRIISGIIQCSSAAHAGAIARPTMALTRRSTIGSIAGLSADIGRRSLKRSPAAARTEWLCRSTPPRSKRIARRAAEKGGV